MKLLGKIFLFFVFAAVVSGVYYWQVLRSSPIPFDNNTSTNHIETYTNDKYQFEIKYSKQYMLAADATGISAINYFKNNGETQATITIPSSQYPKTNFNEAYMTFAVAKNLTASACTKTSTAEDGLKGSVVFDQTEKINGNDFLKTQFSDAGAGNLYDIKLYRIFHNNLCYEISLTLHTGNIQAYEPGTVTEINKDDIWSKLDLMLHTFKFSDQVTNPTPNSTGGDTAKSEGTLSGHVEIKNVQSPDVYDLTQIVVYSSDRSKIVEKVSLDSSGNYSTDLPVGTYYITYNTISTVLQPPMNKIIINKDSTVTQNFTIDN